MAGLGLEIVNNTSARVSDDDDDEMRKELMEWILMKFINVT